MYDNALTQYEQFEEYRPDDTLTRQEAAKFFGTAATLVKTKSTTPETDCVFTDAAAFDSTLAPRIATACEQGLLRGRGGAFHPNDPLTKAQALTVIVRMLYGSMDETVDPWRTAYVEKARDEGITNEKDITRFEQPVTRYDSALLLYRAVTGETVETTEVISVNDLENEQSELLKILVQLGLRTK